MSEATVFVGNEMIYFPEFDMDDYFEMYPAMSTLEVD